MSEPLYKTVGWGQGAGLLVCQLCGALVFPEPDDETDRHEAWHALLNDGTLTPAADASASDGSSASPPADR